jgi:hypothetical protein
MSPSPDPARELAAITDEIAALGDEHLDVTGKPALHVGRCSRSDLHDRLVTLHMRAKALAPVVALLSDPRRI